MAGRLRTASAPRRRLTHEATSKGARRTIALGQAVRFVDFRTGQLRQGKVIAKHPTQATVFEDAVRRSWKIPYVSVEAVETTPGDTVVVKLFRTAQ
jgi:hypothetical protein